MRIFLALCLAALCLSACPDDTMKDPDMGMPDMTFVRIFDPCVDNPQPGYDPASKGHAACCMGEAPAHCVPKDQVIPRLVDQLDECDDTTVCLPDPIIRAGGQYKPQTCTAMITGGPGACFSKCVSQVANNPSAAFLSQDGCGEGELCVPCVNPLDNKRTGACELIELLCAMPDMSVPADLSMPADLAPIVDGMDVD